MGARFCSWLWCLRRSSAIRLNFPDDRSLPGDVESRSVGDVVRSIPGTSDRCDGCAPRNSAGADQLDGYAGALSQLPHVVAVKLGMTSYVDGQRIGEMPVPDANGAYLRLLPDVDPYSDAAHLLLDQVRGTPAPGTVHVGGLTAENVDTKDALFDRVPLAVALIVLAMFGVLFAFTEAWYCR